MIAIQQSKPHDRSRLARTVRCGVGILGFAAALILVGCGAKEPAAATVPVEMRRLSEDQYRNVIRDVFGPGITNFGGRFDPLPRTAGLLALGASSAAITPSGFARYGEAARSIASQVVSERNRNILIRCQPKSVSEPDDVCAEAVFRKIGRLLYRRPLTPAELQAEANIAASATKTLGDFYAGIANGLATMLVSPQFLYVADFTESDPAHPDARRLEAYSKASRLSFLLWNTTPDSDLLTAAETGELDTDAGVARVVDAMLASPRLEAGVRAFIADMFGFDEFDTLQKDNAIYPAFTAVVAADAKEQALRTAVDFLVTQRGDYRDLFTTRKTFLSRSLGVLFNVPVDNPDKWVPYEFPEGDPHVGIQTEPSFLALHAHAGTSSPTLRGRALRELLLCQKIPDPPANVNFELFNDPNSAFKTTRQRLEAHRTEPACAGCHKLMDPIGVTLENFDGAGQWRAAENGAAIDTSGEIDGVAFKGAEGLGKMMHDNPAVTACAVNRLFSYSTGRIPTSSDHDLITYFGSRFAADGYRLPELLRSIVTSKAFFAIVPAGAETKSAQSPAGSAGKESKS